MTAKQELKDLVDEMDESEASILLEEGRQLLRSRSRLREHGRLTFADLIHLPRRERERYLKEMAPDVELDEEEVAAWDATLADGLDDE